MISVRSHHGNVPAAHLEELTLVWHCTTPPAERRARTPIPSSGVGCGSRHHGPRADRTGHRGLRLAVRRFAAAGMLGGPAIDAAAAATPTTSAGGPQKAGSGTPAIHRASPSKSASSRSPAPSASATTRSPSSAPPAPAPTEPATSSGCQQSFVPSYFYSGTLWDQVIDTSPRPATMFLNVDNGVGTAPVAHFQQLVKSAQQHGITVLGYSSTEYTARPIARSRPRSPTTRPGTASTASCSTPSRARPARCRTTSSFTTTSTRRSPARSSG